MVNAEKHKYLSEDQHGGRNGREALDIVFGKTITFDTLHLQRSNFGCTDCDAKACYDCTLPGIVSIAETNTGAPPAVSTLFSLPNCILVIASSIAPLPP